MEHSKLNVAPVVGVQDSKKSVSKADGLIYSPKSSRYLVMLPIGWPWSPLTLRVG